MLSMTFVGAATDRRSTALWWYRLSNRATLLGEPACLSCHPDALANVPNSLLWTAQVAALLGELRAEQAQLRSEVARQAAAVHALQAALAGARECGYTLHSFQGRAAR